MRLLRSGLIMLVVLSLFAPAMGAFAPKPPNFTTASVVFRDAPDDRIRSDGAAYVDGGQRGLEVRMWINGSQDLTIGTFHSGRMLHFIYQPEVILNAPAPQGQLLDNAFVNVREIANMAIGQTRLTKASFNTAVGYFRWLGSPFPAGGSIQGESYGSQAVQVTRRSQSTWDVHTDPGVSLVDEATTPPTDYSSGDLSVLLVDGRRGTLTPKALYRMPFGLTVTCPSCP